MAVLKKTLLNKVHHEFLVFLCWRMVLPTLGAKICLLSELVPGA